MHNIYTVVYVCRAIGSAGLPGYNDVVLGLSMGNNFSDIEIRGTLSRFVVGKEYLVNIMEKP